MKLKRKFFGRILASLMLLAISLPCSFNGQAQITYRGFVEGGLGIDYLQDDGLIEFSYMLATTHGVQLKNNFIGLGLGIIPGYNGTNDGDVISKVCLPLYAKWRYDFFNSDIALKPYIGIKAGYYLPISKFIDKSGFPLYAALDFGLRKRVTQTSGISFGLAVQTSNDGSRYRYSFYHIENKSVLGLNFLAKVAFDF